MIWRRASVGSVIFLCLSLNFDPGIAICADEANCSEEPLDDKCQTKEECQPDFRCIGPSNESALDRKERVCVAEKRCGENIKRLTLGPNLSHEALMEEIKLAQKNKICLRLGHCRPVTLPSHAQNMGESLNTSRQVASDPGLFTQIMQWFDRLR